MERGERRPGLANPTASALQALLSATSATIKSIDPSATVLTSGLAEFPANSDGQTMATFLTALERDPAFRSSADVVALHGYAANPAGLVRVLDQARSIMRAAGDDRPIWITELGWASAGPAHAFVSDRRPGAVPARRVRHDGRVPLAVEPAACHCGFLFRHRPATLGEGDYWGMHTASARPTARRSPRWTPSRSTSASASCPGAAASAAPSRAA